MRGVSRGRIISAIITTVALTALVASFIVFFVRPGGPRTASTGRTSATATATNGATAQFTPAPGVTVTVHATATRGTSSSSSTSTTAYTGGAGGTTPVTPPRYPTPLPTSGGSYGSGATPTSVNPTPTPTHNPSTWYPGPTPTVGPPPYDDAQLLSQSPTSLTGYEYGYTPVSFTMLNTGTTTWNSANGYSLRCSGYCGLGWYASTGTFQLPPGNSFTFKAEMDVLSGAFYYTVQHSYWRLYNTATGAFGDTAEISIVQHGWDQSGVFAESAPSCQSDGSTWTQHGAGSVSCGGSLTLAGGGPGSVAMELVQTPSGYSYTSYLVKVHIHFDTTSATTYAGVVLAFPSSADTYHQTEFMVSPAGYYCETQTLSYCVPGASSFSMPASSDYDIVVDVYSSSGFSATANGSGPGGGFIGGGATGLIELTASGSTDAAYFSNYQLYQHK
jgi:hypothetical protein